LDDLSKLSLGKSVHYLGEVTDEELRSLYARALFVAFPSVYEGFGFPVLEALQAGKAVLCANSSSLPEVGGDAVHYVEPESVESISDGMELLINAPERRSALAEMGRRRLEGFCWSRCAREVLGVYEKVAARL